MSPAKLGGGRMLKVRPAEQDLERLKPHLGLLFPEQTTSRWESAANLNPANGSFRNQIGQAIVQLLVGCIAENHLAGRHDRREVKNLFRRERKARRLILRACQLYGSEWRTAPRELENVLLRWIAREVEMERVAGQIGKMRRGPTPYGAFAKFVRLVGKAYESATNKSAIVKINYGREADERCSGPFGALLEAARTDAAAIWEKAGFGTSLNGPRDRNARLEYARKVMLESRANHHLG